MRLAPWKRAGSSDVKTYLKKVNIKVPRLVLWIYCLGVEKGGKGGGKKEGEVEAGGSRGGPVQ